MNINVNVVLTHELAVLPSQKNTEDVGYDLTAVAIKVENGYIEIDTGVAIEVLDPNYWALVVPRSSLSNTDLVLANSVGVIDPPYRNSIRLRFKPANLFSEVDPPREFVEYKVGDRVGQLIFLPKINATFNKVETLSTTDRGLGGFGSTGN